MKGGDGACKTWEEGEEKMVSGESDVMGPCEVTGDAGVGIVRSLEESPCNSPTPGVLRSKGHHRKGGRNLHWREGIQAPEQTGPQTWTPSALEAVHVSFSCLVYEHSAKGRRSMQDESKTCRS